MASLASWAICILAARKGLFFGPVVLVFDLIYHVFFQYPSGWWNLPSCRVFGLD